MEESRRGSCVQSPIKDREGPGDDRGIPHRMQCPGFGGEEIRGGERSHSNAAQGHDVGREALVGHRDNRQQDRNGQTG